MTHVKHRMSTGTQSELTGVEVMPKTATKLSASTKCTAYDVSEHLRTPQEMVAYLNAWLEEAPDDAAGIARALEHRCCLTGRLTQTHISSLPLGGA